MSLNIEYFKRVLCDILAIDSPTGFCGAAIARVQELAREIGYDSYLTKKGNMVMDIAGQDDSKTVGISAHVDTLGLVVRGFNTDGTLTFSKVGGSILPTLDGEYCKIYTRWGKVYTGTILSNSTAGHVYEDAHDLARNAKNMHIKLDEMVSEADGAKALDILPGDFICYDPKTIITDTGFIKSRFLDDKMGVALVLATLKHFKDNNIKSKHNLCVVFSTYEEIGHGLAHLPREVDEFVAIDMGCIGDDLSGSEFAVSICAKDSSGPYDYELTTRLINMAKEANLNYAVDIYPMYGSDVSAAYRAGHDMKGALMGPGIAASHGMERSHIQAAENSFALLCLYLTR
ncbi:MAG: M42 family metallopeptidase [Defluviitaleaceae bacterium]|nr:M42 family metallopeptidase [Defluviitaleaceae bacterium]